MECHAATVVHGHIIHGKVLVTIWRVMVKVMRVTIMVPYHEFLAGAWTTFYFKRGLEGQ